MINVLNMSTLWKSVLYSIKEGVPKEEILENLKIKYTPDWIMKQLLSMIEEYFHGNM